MTETKRAANESPLRVLVLHQHYWPEIAATAQILTDVCEDLVARGHTVQVICGRPSYHASNSSQTTLPRLDRQNGVDILRVPTYVPKRRTIPLRLIQYFSFFATSLRESMRETRPDVCLVMSTPPLLLGISGTLLRRIRGVPFVYSVQDLYPDIAIHLGVLPAKGPLPTLVESVASVCYKTAESVVTLSDGMAERLRHKGVAPDRIQVIPNWADTSAIRPSARNNPLAYELGLADRFVVQYSGNLGLSQGLSSLLDAAEHVRELPILFAVVGNGNARDSLVKEASARGLKNVRFFPPQPRAHLSELLAACDLGVVTMKRGVSSDLVPSKLYGIMAAGRPVLACVEAGSEVARVVAQSDCGWVVEPEDGLSASRAIRAAYSEAAATRLARGARGADTCARDFSRSLLTARYEEALVKAATGSGRPPDRKGQRDKPASTNFPPATYRATPPAKNVGAAFTRERTRS